MEEHACETCCHDEKDENDYPCNKCSHNHIDDLSHIPVPKVTKILWSSSPIMSFENDEQLQKCLAEWMDRLFLSEWNIKASLVHGEEISGLAGESNIQWANSCGLIKIRYANEMPDDQMEKQPHEGTLVHELLHFKMMEIENNTSIETVFWNEKQHQLLEQIAKSLLMAKYRVGYDWFKQ